MTAPLPPRPVAFGLNVDPHVAGLPAAGRIAALADTAGLEYVGVQDHPYQADFVDTFTLITWLAAATESVRFLPNVANLPLRPPAMLAKQAASIDLLSGGRFELGLGAGGFPDAIAGMGGPRRSTGEARAALGEAIDIIRAAWAGAPYAHDGAHYSVPAARPGPRPAHEIGVWLGVVGPRALRLLGATADGWSVSSPYVPPERLPGLNAAIDGAAREAGRDPGRIVRLYNLMGTITPAAEDRFNGPVAHWVDTLTGLYTDHGMNAFVFWPSRDRERQSHVFAEEVVPAVRERLAAAR
ncbi:LLM class flavin-dependent oxidoreductase [Streptomyces sp. SBT349]|uniref:LLM class flavin-dependent oxidoreductase n=1 Tax=Streptomyces sp. SBT349 TaxID=1580539 RepID=UPI00066BF150|nr:LLM class flavin-dependent oxidoreductase [Streptomyces sp. SBT349]